MAPGDDLAKEGARKKEENENCRSEFSKKKERTKCTPAKKREVFSSAALQGPSPPSLPLFASGKIKGHLRRPKEEADREKRPRFSFLWRVPFRSGDEEWKRGPVCIPSTLYSTGTEGCISRL